MSMKRKSLAAIAAGVMVTAMTAYAAEAAQLTTSGGTWTDVDPDGPTDFSGLNTNQISWGDPADTMQSSYVFEGVEDEPINLPGTPGGMITFDMGTFTHNNFPIFGTSITGATLSIPLDLVNGDLVDTDLTFEFAHNETPNNASPCDAGGSQPCPDEVSISGSTPDQFFEADGMTFQFEIFGFEVDGVTNPTFLTDEGQANVATLRGKITKVPPQVPVPSTLGLLGIGLVGLGYVASRKRKAA